jgi:hypothetical protein
MTRNRTLVVVVTLVISLLVVASLLGSGALAWFVSGRATATPTPTRTPPATPIIPPTLTSTPDPCAPANLPAQIASVHDLMREFDDGSLLAQNTPLQSLSPLVSDLQRIRREAEDQVVPACLTDLKEYQLAHMNVVLQTFLLFLSTGQNAEAAEISALIEQARQLHGQYDAELSRLMGWTPMPTVTPGTPGPGGSADTLS